jgi:lipid-A-disaccharide synthase-like uncharacterized protein
MFKAIGALGLILISVGILTKARQKQNILYIFGGICLEIYSIYLNDAIFIILQVVFTLAAAYDLLKVYLRANKNEP